MIRVSAMGCAAWSARAPAGPSGAPAIEQPRRRPTRPAGRSRPGSTDPSRWPRKELDFILYGQGIVPRAFDIPAVPLSDHLPLVFDFDVDPGFVRAKDTAAAAGA